VTPGDPVVTVVIPTHNRLRLLRRTVQLALNQREVDLRVLVVDDGSEDGTGEAMARHADPRVEVLRLDPVGHPARVRNAGLDRVTSEWVAFLDDDDLWAPDKLRMQLGALRRQPDTNWSAVSSIRFSVPGYRLCGGERVPRADSLFPNLLRRNTIPGGGSSVVARADLIRDLGGFAEDSPRSEDWDMWIRLAVAGRFAAVDVPLVGYRMAGSGRASRQNKHTNLALQQWIQERHAALRHQHEVLGFDDLAVRRYIAQANARSGRRGAALREYLGAGVRHRRVQDLALGAVAAVSPELSIRIRDKRELARLDPQWLAFGWGWLAPLLEDERRADLTG
jgi:hypothetical protein